MINPRETRQIPIDEILGRKVKSVKPAVFEGHNSRLRIICHVSVLVVATLLASITVLSFSALIQTLL